MLRDALKTTIRTTRISVRWAIHKLRRGDCVVVLGMHRSGTSFLTSVLAGQGFDLGTARDGGSLSKWNAHGHFESWKCVSVNNRILHDSGGSWDYPPTGVHATFATRLRMREALADFGGDRPFAIKDPRFSLTCRLWESLLPSTHFIVCFRHPIAVAESLKRRNGLSREKAVSLWNTYNRSVLELCDEHRSPRSVVYFNYDEIDKAEVAIQAICNRCGVPFRASVLGERYSDALRHHGDSDVVPEEVENTYQELLHRWWAARDVGQGNTRAVESQALE